MTSSVAGKVVAITGGARGIGLAIATALHSSGAKIAIGDIDEPGTAAAGERLGLPLAMKLDVTDRSSFTGFLNAVENQLGPLDVLVNNAGLITVGSAVEEADEPTRRLFDVNVHGVILGTKLAADRMLPRRRGHVINIGSLASVLPTEGIATYCATKHAVLGYTDAVRLENHGSGVHFTVVMPTLTNTDMVAGVGHAKGFKNAEPEDVARAVVDVIGKPQPRVAIPRSLGATVWVQRLMPIGLAEALSRALGAGRVFTSDLQRDQHDVYTRRTGLS
jgi:short-subunit dehydrogenase